MDAAHSCHWQQVKGAWTGTPRDWEDMQRWCLTWRLFQAAHPQRQEDSCEDRVGFAVEALYDICSVLRYRAEDDA
jgi:hypothetical protein